LDNLRVIFQPKALAKGLSLIFRKGIDNSDFAILTDEIKLVQILSNLISNALKFTHKGFVELEYLLDGEYIIFNVKDTGIGIEEIYYESIFERFRQANAKISANYGGTGLGLSISKSFAEMLGGVISVKSILGKGSTFTLTIPCKESNLHAKDEILEKTQVQFKGVTILIADDEQYNYQLIEAYLADTRYKLLYARNGREAVDLFHKHPEISLILMDIKMPELNGQLALNEIRKFDAMLPVIAQTAYAMEHEKQQLLAGGFNDYISKPLNRELLLEKISNLLLQHQKS